MKLSDIVKSWMQLDKLNGVNAVIDFLTGGKGWDTELEDISAKQLDKLHSQLINIKNSDFAGRGELLNAIIEFQKKLEHSNVSLLRETASIVSSLSLDTSSLCDQKNINTSQEVVETKYLDTSVGFRSGVDDLATKLKKIYSTKGKIYTLFSKHELPITDINLSIIDYRPKSRRVDKENKETKYPNPALEFQLEEYLADARTAIPVAEVFKKSDDGKKSPARLLVIGDAGTGKTTMSQYFAYRWATAGLWADKFDYVFWIPLRYLKDEKISLAEVINQYCLKGLKLSDSQQNLIEDILQKNDRILWLLDGYDEVSHWVDKEGSHLANLLTILFNQKHVLLTSRPYYVQRLEIHFDRQLENSGFTDKNIKNYLDQYFRNNPKQGETLYHFLKHENSDLWDAAHSPIQLSLVCDLWSRNDEALSSQLNKTGLYQKMSEYLLKEQWKKQGSSTESLTLGNLLKSYQTELAIISQLAFESLASPARTLITPELQTKIQNETSSSAASFNKALMLGFLKPLGDEKCEEIEKPHEFLHFSFQEFWAAYYVMQGLQQRGTKNYKSAIDFVRQQKYNIQYIRVFSFLSGWLSSDKAAEQPLFDFWHTVLNQPVDLNGIGHFRVMIHCLEEAYEDKRVVWRNTILQWVRQGIEINIREFVYLYNYELIEILQQNTKVAVCDEIIMMLQKALEDKNLYVREKAAETLVKWGEKAAKEAVIKALQKALGDKNERVRRKAAKALGKFGEKAAKDSVIEVLQKILLEDKSIDVRRSAAETLGMLGEKAAKESVIEALQKTLLEDTYVRRRAAQALGRLGEKAAKESVIEALQKTLIDDEDEEARLNAAEALSKLGEKVAEESVIEVLQKTLVDDEDEEVTLNAAETLSNLGEKVASESEMETFQKILLKGKSIRKWIRNGGKASEEYLNNFGTKDEKMDAIDFIGLQKCISTYFQKSYSIEPSHLAYYLTKRTIPIIITPEQVVIYEKQRCEIKLHDSTSQRLAQKLLQALIISNERKGIVSFSLQKTPIISTDIVGAKKITLNSNRDAFLAHSETNFTTTLPNPIPFYRTALLIEEWDQYQNKKTHTVWCNLDKKKQTAFVKIKLNYTDSACLKDEISVLDSVLAKCKNGYYLDLSDNRLNDQSAFYLANQFIKNNKSLKILVLSRNYIAEKGLEHLLKAASESSVLRYLFLDGNHIAFNDYFCKKTLEPLLEKTPLKIIDLSMNFIFAGAMVEEKGVHEKDIKPVYDESDLQLKLLEQKLTEEDRFYCHRYFESSPIIRSSCLPSVSSVIDKDKAISKEKGVVALVAYKTKFPFFDEHAFLVIEVLQPSGQRSMMMADLYVTEQGIHIQVSYCSAQEYLHRTGQGQKVHLDCALLPIAQLQAVIKKMLESRDRKEFLRYATLPTDRAGVYNCLTWAYDNLSVAGILKKPDSWFPSQEVGNRAGGCVIA